MTIIEIKQDNIEQRASRLSMEEARQRYCEVLNDVSGIVIDPDTLAEDWPEGKMLVRQGGGYQVWVKKLPVSLHFTTEKCELELSYREDVQALVNKDDEKILELLLTADM